MTVAKSLRRLILDIVNPLLVYLGELHSPFTHKKITGVQYQQIIKKIKAGDIIITRKRGEFSNFILDDFYTHGAIVTEKDYVVEAIGKGVLKTDMITFLLSKDYVAVLRPKFCTEYQMECSIEHAKSLVGSAYDYDFHPGNNKFYCAELIWYVFNVQCGDPYPFIRRKTLDVDTVTAENFYEARTKFDCVYESRKKFPTE